MAAGAGHFNKAGGFSLFLSFASALLAPFIVTIKSAFQSYEQQKAVFMWLAIIMTQSSGNKAGPV